MDFCFFFKKEPYISQILANYILNLMLHEL